MTTREALNGPLAASAPGDIPLQRTITTRCAPVSCGHRAVLLALVISSAVAGKVAAQPVGDFVPLSAPHCRVTTAPPDAGIAVTPGGFVMVHPRNAAMPDDYTGCKVLWVVDVDAMRRLATLYFERGALARVIAHDVRDSTEAIEVACDLTQRRSLLPNAGRRATDAMCVPIPDESLYGLRLATWPRQCLKEPKTPVCAAEPK